MKERYVHPTPPGSTGPGSTSEMTPILIDKPIPCAICAAAAPERNEIVSERMKRVKKRAGGREGWEKEINKRE